MPAIAWHNLELTEVFAKLNSPRSGLSVIEAQRRLKKFGSNVLPEKKKISNLFVLISQFRSPLAYILIVAGLVSFFIGQFVDAAVIFAALFINAIGGFIQERKASSALNNLKKIVDYKAIVIRDGEQELISSKQLVRGDLLVIRAGDQLTADARLIQAQNLTVNEALLTGEAAPINKDIKILSNGTILAERRNMIYAGTTVTSGSGLAIICETGKSTEIGKIATLLRETPEEETPLQKKLKHFSQFLGIFVLVVSLLIFILGIFSGQSLFEMFLVSIALAVSAVPEGLLISVTVILAIGMQRILKKNALVRRLSSAETLGSTTVICTDKTGTLTEGKMQVAYLMTAGSEFEKGKNLKFSQTETDHPKSLIKLINISLICNNAVIENPRQNLNEWRLIGSPTEQALVLMGSQLGLIKNDIDKKIARLAEMPFSSEAKIMATLNRTKEGLYSINAKGAPEEILKLASSFDQDGKICPMTGEIKNKLISKYETLTKKGLRVLALAYKDLPTGFLNNNSRLELKNLGDLILVGFIGIKDPLREEVKATIGHCKASGIRPVIVTGDHYLTAKAIAEEAGITAAKQNMMEGKDLITLNDADFKKLVKKINVFARVSPSDKLRIIKAHKDNGEVVAMTGDGINDAPALKAADIGIALGNGVDVAKEAADIVLLDNNFKTIVSAIEEGRIIFDNIRKVILYLLSDTFSEIILIGGGLLLGLPLPLLAIQILWINLINDGLPAIALTFDSGDAVSHMGSRSANEPILNRQIKGMIVVISLVSGLVSLMLFWLIYNLTGDLDRARTMAFVCVGLDSLFYIFSCRSLHRSIIGQNIFSNPYLLASVSISFFLLLAVVYLPAAENIFHFTPLSLGEWIIVAVFCLIILIFAELAKLFFAGPILTDNKGRQRPAIN